MSRMLLTSGQAREKLSLNRDLMGSHLKIGGIGGKQTEHAAPVSAAAMSIATSGQPSTSGCLPTLSFEKMGVSGSRATSTTCTPSSIATYTELSRRLLKGPFQHGTFASSFIFVVPADHSKGLVELSLASRSQRIPSKFQGALRKKMADAEF